LFFPFWPLSRKGKERIHLCDLSASVVKKHKTFKKIRHSNYEIEYLAYEITEKL
jgi:hypothetical protein